MTLFDIFYRYKKDTRILSIMHLDNFTHLRRNYRHNINIDIVNNVKSFRMLECEVVECFINKIVPS